MSLNRLSNTTEIALMQWSEEILEAYINGNNSDARARFRQVPENRKAYVAMTMLEGRTPEVRADVKRFIVSVTE